MHTRFESYGSYYRLEFLVRPVLMALRRFYRACDRVVAPSQPIADSMQAQGMGENIGIWTRGVDLEAVRRYRHAWGVFRDRRPDLYRTLLTLDGEHVAGGA